MTEVEFGALFQFLRNGMNVKQDKSGVGLPITRIETIADSTIDSKRVGYAGLKEDDCRNWLLKPGDILFSHINSVSHIGKCAVYRGDPDKLVHGMNLLCLRCDTKKLVPEFAKYLITSSGFRARLSSFINKAVNQASVSIGNLKTIPVRVPEVAEQERIAAILDKADELRAKRRTALAQVDTLRQSTFLNLFGDPITNPKRWALHYVGDLINSVSNGMTRRGRESDVGTTIVLRLRDIRAGWIDFSDVNRINLTHQEADRYQVFPGDLLFIRVNGNPEYVGRCAVFEGFDEPVYFNDHIMRVKVDKSQVVGIFLAFVLNGARGKREIALHRKTSAGQHTINQEGLSKIRIALPPYDLQLEFARRVAAIEKLKTAYHASITEMNALFASLQHCAFRGEL